MNNSRSTFLAIGLGLLAFILIFGFPKTIEKQKDSNGYLLFAQEISSGSLFLERQAPWPSVIHTPGYPAMLALSQSLIGDTPAAVVLVHMSLAFLAIFALVFRFRKFLAAGVIVSLGLLAFWLWRDYYDVVLSEWSAFCVLMIFLSFTPQNYEECSPLRLCLLGLLLSLMVLIHPAFLSCLAVVALFVVLVVRRSERRKVSVGLLLGILPLFFWCTFNSYRLGTFRVAAFSGHNLFGVASVLGSTEFKKEEWPDLARFSAYVNSNKVPKPGEEEDLVAGLPANYAGLPCDYNVYQVALGFEKERNHPRQYYDELMSSYARQVIFAHPLEYLNFVSAGLGSLLRDLWLLIISSVLLAMLIRSGHPLSLVLCAALGNHLLHILLCSALQIVVSRYYLLTFIPLGFMTLLAMLAVIGGRRGETESPV